MSVKPSGDIKWNVGRHKVGAWEQIEVETMAENSDGTRQVAFKSKAFGKYLIVGANPKQARLL